MSLFASLNSALVGLDVASRRAQTVSENIANVGRDGFGRRELAITPVSPQLTGIRTTIQRTELSGEVALKRDAQGRSAANRDPAAFWSAIEAQLGVPGTGDSLSDRVTSLEARLIDATSRPSSTDTLNQVSRALNDVVSGVNAASDEIQHRRQTAENDIVKTVAQLNRDLEAIEDLNLRIQKQSASGGETARLEDQRALALDSVAGAVGIRVLQRDFGAIALISDAGQILLDGKAKTVEFTPSVQVTPDRALGMGLNGLVIDGRSLPTTGPSSLSGGRLEGLFQVRDQDAQTAQAELDAYANELIGRFSDPAIDQTLMVGEQGLFVDAATGPGVAGRLAVNSLVALDGSSETWRIRDGLNALAPDPTTPTGLLDGYLSVLNRRAPPADPILGTAAQSIGSLATDLTSGVSSQSGFFEQETQRAAALLRSADEGLVGNAVDIDEEMRRLIEIEQSYAAAARVVEVVDEMMDRLSRI